MMQPFEVSHLKKFGDDVVRFTENFSSLELATEAFESLLKDKETDNRIKDITFKVR